jgi:hypothetical protein
MTGISARFFYCAITIVPSIEDVVQVSIYGLVCIEENWLANLVGSVTGNGELWYGWDVSIIGNEIVARSKDNGIGSGESSIIGDSNDYPIAYTLSCV